MADQLTWLIWPQSAWLSLLTWLVVLIVVASWVRSVAVTALQQVFRVLRHALARVTWRLQAAAQTLAQHNDKVLIMISRSYLEREIKRQAVHLQYALENDLAQIEPMSIEVRRLIEKMQEDYAATQEQTPELPEWLRAAEAMANAPATQSGNRTLQHLLQQLLERIQQESRQVRQEYRQAIADRHAVLNQFLPFWRRLLHMQGDIGQGVRRIEQRAERLEHLLEQFDRLSAGTSRALRPAVGSILVHFTTALLITAGLLVFGLVSYWVIAPAVVVLIPVATYEWGIVSVVALLLGQVMTGLVLLENVQATRLLRGLGATDAILAKNLRRMAFVGLLIWSLINALLTLVGMNYPPISDALVVGTVENPQVALGARVLLALMIPWVLTLIVIPLEPLLNGLRLMLGTSVVGGLLLLAWVMRLGLLLLRIVERFVLGLYDLVCAPLNPVVQAWQQRKQSQKTAETHADAPSDT